MSDRWISLRAPLGEHLATEYHLAAAVARPSHSLRILFVHQSDVLPFLAAGWQVLGAGGQDLLENMLANGWKMSPDGRGVDGSGVT